jgi:hypothetical protein
MTPDHTNTLASEQDLPDHQMRNTADRPRRSSVLPKTLRRAGFDLELVERRGDRAIYRQTKASKFVSFEAIVIRTRGECVLPNGRVFVAGEVYPADRQWGEIAWTCMTLDRAYVRLGWDQAQ